MRQINVDAIDFITGCVLVVLITVLVVFELYSTVLIVQSESEINLG